MKILFKNLPEGEGTVKVSLDGGDTFRDHPINTVRENGIQLADDQDYSKIMIKGNANIFRNLDVISSVKVDGTGIPYTYEKPVYGLGTVTYKCYAWDNNNDGQITEDDNLPNTHHIWVKNVNDENIIYTTPIGTSGLADSVNDLVLLSDFAPEFFMIELTDEYFLGNFDSKKGLRYPEGDLTYEEETIVGTETVTENIKFIQDPPTVTENGTVIADEGKAFKSATVEVPKSELGFKCFYNYAPSHYFGDEPESTDTQDSDIREYNILMSNEYLKNLCSEYLGLTYNGVVGLHKYENGQDIVNNYYTLDSEYNLFEYYTSANTDTLLLYFYDSLTSQDSFHTVRVRLIDGTQFEYEPM